ncbi:hypothetical protein [uncultured Microbacterium sp.]|uniref:hypothetical protein n=1 Tax=uncultured Microbacterium sp. TaxID=191216 RepID=UPI0025EB0E5C|nr:hypothetical protein [uncultured Microbacterium sp.]
MSTSENPENPPLTRRQLRELRQTGATPIITSSPADETPDAETPAPVVEPAPEAPASDEPAAPAPVAEQPAREQEPEPAIVSEVPAATPEQPTDGPAVTDDSVAETPVVSTSEPALRPASFESFDGFDAGGEFGVSGLTRRQARAQEKIRTAAVPIISPDLEPSPPHQPVPSAKTDEAEASPAIFRPAVADSADDAVEAPAPSVVNPALGSDLLQGATPEVTLPASFDQLISRNTGSTGAVSTPNALILSQTPTGVPLVGPVNATGEIMITGTFELPEGLGSVGHAPGTTDGRDADAVLLDGELPPASSPTPIAASAAISTVKQPGEIIRPPAPEKGSKLLVGLIVTTGALALAVAVTLVLAFTTGVFR